MVVGERGPARPALELLAIESPDVVIVDPRLPDVAGGLAFIERIRARDPRRPDRRHELERGPRRPGARRGGDGFIRKTFRPNDLVAAICSASGRPA